MFQSVTPLRTGRVCVCAIEPRDARPVDPTSAALLPFARLRLSPRFHTIDTIPPNIQFPQPTRPMSNAPRDRCSTSHALLAAPAPPRRLPLRSGPHLCWKLLCCMYIGDSGSLFVRFTIRGPALHSSLSYLIFDPRIYNL